MKRIIYIIMMLYYAVMCVDLFVGIYPITFINIFSPPFLYIVWFALPVTFLFYISIISIILFTTLAHFYKGSFKIIAVICLCLMAIGNGFVMFEEPTFLLNIVLIALTVYIAKENTKTKSTATSDKKRNCKIFIAVLLSIALLISVLIVNVEMYKNDRLSAEKQAFYEIKGDYELLIDNILIYIEKTQYSEPYCVYIYEKDGKAFLKGTSIAIDEAYSMEVDISIYESYQRIEQSYSDLGYYLWCIRIDKNAINFDGETGFAIIYSIDNKSLKEKGMDTRTGTHIVWDKMEDNWYIRNSWRHAR